MLGLITEPFSRLKYGIFPVNREVVDYDDEVDPAGENSGSEDEKLTADHQEEAHIEYRDENGRKWWKFFDEYEYRSNKATRSKHKWYKWFNENDTPAERKLILKLDLILTIYSMAAYWVKFLSSTNLNSVYALNEFREDLNMGGNDLVNTQVVFNIGNIVFQLPFIFLLNAAPLNYLLPAFDIAWSIVTVFTFKVTDVPSLKALRFLIGAFEAQAYYSYHFLLGSWFTADEISRRAMVFYFGQFLGVLTSGLLSGAIIRGMDGLNGLKSWQWIFIVDGLVSLVVGVIGIYSIPGTPKNCYSIFLTDDEIRLARKRLKRNNIGSREDNYSYKNLLNWDLWKSVFTSWEVYVLSWWNIFCWNNSNGSSGAYILWLKSLTKTNSQGQEVQRFTDGDLQDRSALTPGLGLVWLTIICSFADLSHSRWGAILLSQVFNILGNTLLAVWDVSEGVKWFAWCLQYFGWAMAPVLYSWQNDICRRDQQKRSITLIFMNAIAQSTTAFMAVIVWKTVEAPRYLKGYTFTACSGFTLCLWTFVVLYFYKRSERQKALENGIYLFNSANPNDIPEAIKVEKHLVEDSDKQSEKNLSGESDKLKATEVVTSASSK